MGTFSPEVLFAWQNLGPYLRRFTFKGSKLVLSWFLLEGMSTFGSATFQSIISLQGVSIILFLNYRASKSTLLTVITRFKALH